MSQKFIHNVHTLFIVIILNKNYYHDHFSSTYHVLGLPGQYHELEMTVKWVKTIFTHPNVPPGATVLSGRAFQSAVFM